VQSIPTFFLTIIEDASYCCPQSSSRSSLQRRSHYLRTLGGLRDPVCLRPDMNSRITNTACLSLDRRQRREGHQNKQQQFLYASGSYRHGKVLPLAQHRDRLQRERLRGRVIRRARAAVEPEEPLTCGRVERTKSDDRPPNRSTLASPVPRIAMRQKPG
jgi:hypothetical protein